MEFTPGDEWRVARDLKSRLLATRHPFISMDERRVGV
jgi:hypothetical protein